MILTDSDEYSHQARYLSTQAKDDAFLFLHNEVGFNYRLTNIQAALGLAQFENFSNIKNTKANIHSFYQNLFAESENIELISPDSKIESNYWLNIIKFSCKDLQQQAIQKFLSAEDQITHLIIDKKEYSDELIIAKNIKSNLGEGRGDAEDFALAKRLQ